jgi:hypothetical protein
MSGQYGHPDGCADLDIKDGVVSVRYTPASTQVVAVHREALDGYVAEVNALRAQVAAVREVAESIRDAADKARGFHGSPIQWERQKVAEDILRALDHVYAALDGSR